MMIINHKIVENYVGKLCLSEQQFDDTIKPSEKQTYVPDKKSFRKIINNMGILNNRYWIRGAHVYGRFYAWDEYFHIVRRGAFVNERGIQNSPWIFMESAEGHGCDFVIP